MGEELQERTVRSLIASGQPDAARLLASCTLRVTDESGVAAPTDDDVRVVEVEIAGSPDIHVTLRDTEHPVTRAIRAGVRAALPPNTWVQRWTFITTQPREDAAGDVASAKPKHDAGSNQAADAVEVRVWQNLRFRSESELRIAQSLDRAGALFLPNCKARLGPAGSRENREPDFLVCSDGKWGILEVDGEPFHPPARTVHDHERARLFKAHGVRIVEHFDAAVCYRDPDGVVRRFLELLRRT